MSIQVLATFMVIDYISGIIKAIHNKNLDSNVGFRGIFKKMGMLIVVMVGVGVDYFINTAGFMRELIIYYLVLTEALSITENLGAIGVPLPKKFVNTLEKLREEKEDLDEGDRV